VHVFFFDKPVGQRSVVKHVPGVHQNIRRFKKSLTNSSFYFRTVKNKMLLSYIPHIDIVLERDKKNSVPNTARQLIF